MGRKRKPKDWIVRQGKFSGRPLKEVPTEYLIWLALEAPPNFGKTRSMAKRVMQARFHQMKQEEAATA